MNLLVRAVIGTVHITINSRSNHGMIQGSVKLHQVIGIRTLHLYFRKLLVPCLGSLHLIIIEIIFRSLRTQILTCSFHTDTGYTCRHQNFLIFLRIEIETGNISRTDPATIFRYDGSRVHMASHERF